MSKRLISDFKKIEDVYSTFCHIIFPEVSRSYGILLNGSKYFVHGIGNKFFPSSNLELTKTGVYLIVILIFEYVRKLFTKVKTSLLFKDRTVRKDWIFLTRNHLGKFKEIERLKIITAKKKVSYGFGNI